MYEERKQEGAIECFKKGLREQAAISLIGSMQGNGFSPEILSQYLELVAEGKGREVIRSLMRNADNLPRRNRPD